MPKLDDLDEIQNSYEIKPSTIGEPRPNLNRQEMRMNTVTVIEEELPLHKIKQYIKGFKWLVTYYNNITGISTSTSDLSTSISREVQSYTKIDQMAIYLESPLDVTNVSDLSFSGIINSGIVPQLYDIIVVKLIGGKEALFSCTNVETNHYQSHSVYKVDFKLKFFKNETNKDYFVNLEEKVSERLVYDSSYVMDSGSPVLLEDDFKKKQQLKQLRKEILDFFFNKFIDIENKYLHINTKDINYDKVRRSLGAYIDPYQLAFIRSTVEIEENMLLGTIALQDIQRDNVLTVYDMLYRRDLSLLEDIEHKMIYTDPSKSSGGFTAQIRNIYFLDVDYAVAPAYHKGVCIKSIFKDYETSKPGPLSPYEEDDYYIFSGKFYNKDEGSLNAFERLIYKFLRKQPISYEEITEICRGYRKWTDYNQYYAIPILQLIIKSIYLNMYSER